MEILYLIPARGGSKGIPGKNIKILNGKPLLYYTIDVAREVSGDEGICVSTDDIEIKRVCEDYGLSIPFLRPNHLSTDSANTFDVIKHALDYFTSKGRHYDIVVLLQPTSPFRRAFHVREALLLLTKDIDMIVSVKETKSNPYYLLYEEDEEGFLIKSKSLNITRRQDNPKVWELNGSIYVIRSESVYKHDSFNDFRKGKYVMDEIYSVDIDDPLDWLYCEFLISKGLI